MSDQEQIDVTSMDDTEEVPTTLKTSKCGYCDCEKEGLPVFHCDTCGKWVHTSCLHSGSPSPIMFDNYYIFQCVSCSDDGKESFVRMRLTWNQVTSMALFNIAQQSPGKQGFFKWKDAVGTFVDKHWDLLFGSYKKKTGTWANTIAATLSAGNPQQFTSGYGYFKESGWWKLTDPSIPPEYTPGAHDPKSNKNRKSKGGNASSTPSPGPVKVESLRKRSYVSSALNASQLKEKRSRTQKSIKKSITIEKERRDTRTPTSDYSPPSFKGCTSPISSPLSSPRSLSVTSMLSKGDMVPDSTLPLAILSDDSDIEQDKTKLDTSEEYFSPLPMDNSAWTTPCPSPSVLKGAVNNDYSISGPVHKKDLLGNENGSDPASYGFSAFSVVKWDKKNNLNNGTGGGEEHNPWEKVFSLRIPEMSLYEERALLKKLDSCKDFLKEVPEAYRLRRKLLVRQRKRELNGPIISFDATVRRLLAKEKRINIPQQDDSIHAKYLTGGPFPNLPIVSSPHHRILDRFQSPGFSYDFRKHARRTFRQKLIGCDGNENFQCIISPYTQRILKPFIRRDFESKPSKLALLEEIVATCKKQTPGQNGESSTSPIDFSYVRPHHIPSINALCHHFFWPGIDLSESLQYPDFSIVALFKKMVIGFGFMVPDVNFNEAYISFLLVHPDWQHAGIGTFMIYHLIQTCMGKEVTLHVSASNPAMLLYQKFGFKPEKFITDFYDKYHAVNSTECTHAFFMRLRR